MGEIPISNDFIERRLADGFTDYMKYLDGGFFKTSFMVRDGFIAKSMEQIKEMFPKIDPNGFIFGNDAKTKQSICEKDFDKANKEQILGGVRIFNLGGCEAVPMKYMGAEVVCMIPGACGEGHLGNIDRLIPHRLNEQTAREYEGWADLVMSSKVFSDVGGMCQENEMFAGDGLSEAGVEVLEQNMKWLLQMTRAGGFQLHSGSGMKYIVERIQNGEGSANGLSSMAEIKAIEPLYFTRVVEENYSLNLVILRRR